MPIVRILEEIGIGIDFTFIIQYFEASAKPADKPGLYQIGLRLADQRLFLTPNNNGARVEKGLTLISSLHHLSGSAVVRTRIKKKTLKTEICGV